MRTTLTLALATVLAATAVAQRRNRGDRPARELDLTHFTYRVETFPAPSLDRGEARYLIYLPAGYDDEDAADTRYPLAIWLHGMRGSMHRFHDNGGPQILDELRANDAIPPMIFVALSSSSRPLYLDGLPDGDWEKAIIGERLAHLGKTHRIASEREKRAIMGVSIGGFGALRIGLSHPGVFGAIAVHSAVVPPASVADIDDRMMSFIQGGRRGRGLGDVLGDPVDPEKWKRVSPIALVENLDDDALKSLRVYFDAGTDDRYGLAPGNAALHEAFEKRSIPHGFELVEGGEHSWGSGSTQRQLPKSLAFIAACFDGKPMPNDDADPEPQPDARAGETSEKK